MRLQDLVHSIQQEEDSMSRGLERRVGMVLLCLATVCANSHAKTLIVGQPGAPCPNAQYITITDAVNAANPGDVVAICPALYPEQLIIAKPLTLRGLTVNGVGRVLLQPSLVAGFGGLPFEAVIAVTNTHDVTVENLAIDASKNTVVGCAGAALAGIHYFNSSGRVENNAISGAEVADPQSCGLLPASGFGVQVDADQTGSFCVSIKNNSIHDYARNGVYVTGSGVKVKIEHNTISGVGPAGGTFQFGVFVLNGAVGVIDGNVITEGLCGTLSLTDCVALRSEGVTLRAVGDGTEVSNNTISNAQSGIFINGVNRVRVTNNLINNIEGADGIDAQGTSNSLFDGNIIFNAGPVSAAERGSGFVNISCGILEAPGEGTAGGTEEDNKIFRTTVNDAYCGVGHVASTHVESGRYSNTLYTELESDSASFPPPPVEP
jgi:nitrous oxidase accessory protein NosD